MKKINLIIISLSIINVLFAQLTIKSTFESCGLYYATTLNVETQVYYKESAKRKWLSAFPLVFDSMKNELRGSIVRLKENTNYDVKIKLYKDGKFLEIVTESFKTWNSNPVISKTITISSFKGAEYIIDNLKGTEIGWIKVIGDQTVDVLTTSNEAGVRISNCKYVIFEGITLIGGGKHGFLVDSTSSDIRIINCDISKWGRASQETTSLGEYVDANGVIINNDAGIKIDLGCNVVIERCYIHDCKAKTNPWSSIIKVGTYAGKSFDTVHPRGPNAIFVNNAIQGIVLRYNDLIGSQTHRFNDVVESAGNRLYNGGFGTNADIYGNMMCFAQDDIIELDGSQNNVRCFNNRMEQTLCGISTAPNRQGPSYIFNNLIWNLGDENGSTGACVKNGGGDLYTHGRQFFFNNTMYTSKNCISGIGFGTSINRAKFFATTRNNILVSTQTPKEAKQANLGSSGSSGDGLSISDREKTLENDFNNDMLGNTSTSNGAGAIYAVTGSEANGIFALPKWQDATSGVFTLKSNDKGIDKGVVIPNFSGSFRGKAPDMGALELGASSLIPIRPLDMTADKYFIKLKQGNDNQKIILRAGKSAPEMPFTIYKSEDMKWLNVSANATKVKPNAEIEVTISAVSAQTNYTKTGTIIVRLQNGLSIPITVLSE